MQKSKLISFLQEEKFFNPNAYRIQKNSRYWDSFHLCDRCSENFKLLVNERVEVFASDGLYEDKEGEELLNVIEFFDGSIDIEAILQSEIEAFKSDYHYCGQCEQLKGE